MSLNNVLIAAAVVIIGGIILYLYPLALYHWRRFQREAAKRRRRST